MSDLRFRRSILGVSRRISAIKILQKVILVASLIWLAVSPNPILASQPTQSGQGYTVWMPNIQGGQPENIMPPLPTPPPGGGGDPGEWTQEAHDAQRTGYTYEEPARPWELLWTWNGPDANGGTGNHFYDAPPDARTVTGGAHVYVPAGSAGLYALTKTSGQVEWHNSEASFNATPAYDPETGFLYAGGANGTLYKINSDTGSVAGTFAAGSALNKSVLLSGEHAYVVGDNGSLHQVETSNMECEWSYAAGSGAATPPSYSPSRGLVIFATDDLFVHAVRASDGSQAWRAKPTMHTAENPYTFEGYWPVIAEGHGIVFLRMNLGMSALWSGPNCGEWGCGVYPSTNSETRAFLQGEGGCWKNLFALNLDNGTEAFIPAVGFGGVEDLEGGSPILQVGQVPVVRMLDNGQEVAYLNFRSGQSHPNDGRWDSHLGEMVLDNSTIPGLAAGDLRFIDFHRSYVDITDEQTPLTVAGATLFNAHWGASESARITDRSSGLGLSHDNPIQTEQHPTVIRRQAACNSFDPGSHWTDCGLTLYDDGRFWDGPGWWVYWNVYDPPTPDRGAYSDGLKPRYTYVSAGLIIVEGNGGELFVLKHSGQ